MTHPTFAEIYSGEARDHIGTCERCQEIARAIKAAPRGSLEFQRQVMQRLHAPQRRWLLALVPAAALGLLLLLPTSDFVPRGASEAVRVEIVRQGEGFAPRVRNMRDNDIFIGAYLQDAAGEMHWLAPYWPAGAPAPLLVRVKAHTESLLLDTGVIPDAPAKGHGVLVGFAADTEAPVETAITRFYENRTSIEVP